MYYFRFEIPTNDDGSRVSYSPGWFGTMPKCPDKVIVLLFDDKVGFGVAKCEDTIIPSEVIVLGEFDALNLVSNAKDEEGIYFGDKLAHRWDAKGVLDG